MSKIATLAVAFTFLTSTALADGWRRVQNSCGICSYQRVVTPQKVEVKPTNNTTVVNNLIGIPVPVSYNQPVAAQGSTVYGYSSVADTYGKVDMGLLYNQAARLTDQAQQLAGQAATDFAALVQAEGQNRTEVAKILAHGQAARQALEATQGKPQQLTQRTFAFRVTQGSDGKLKVENLTDDKPQTQEKPKTDFELSSGGAAQNISDLLTNKCVTCHGNAKAQGNLNLEQAISDEQQRKILVRATTDDLDKRMPRNADGTAGQKLNVDELRLLFNAMGSSK